ncbi:MAG: 6-bladed beta-propeller [Candidatus Aminicenantes bacterium]|nr:6-bladed beta-propeller [Candidatus Aminicenantes bacterium]
MKIHRGSVLVIGLALLASLAAAAVLSAQDKWKGTIVREGGMTIVKNPKEPLYKTPVLELKEDLSIGGPEAQGEYAFGEIRTFVVDDEGSIYVLDTQSDHIKVFDRSGKYVRTIGRKGQGPGELENPMTLSFNRTAGELAVHQSSRRISYFKTDGTFLRHLSLKEMWALRGRVDSRGNIYITEGFVDEKDPRYETKKLGPDASVIAVLAKSPAPNASVKYDPFMAISSFQLDRDDRLVYGYPLTYEIQFFGPADQKVIKKITREYDPVAVTAEERAEREKDVPQGMTMNFDFSKYHSAYYRFFLSDLGHVIVQTWEKMKDGKSIHDVFDAEGRFIGRVPLKPSGVEILKGKYYALEEDEDGYQTVKRYAVTWTVK